MLRSILAALLVLAALSACGDGGNTPPAGSSTPSLDNESTVVPVTPAEKPATVPAAAAAAGQTTTLGHIERQANQEPQGVDLRKLTDAACQAGVITLTTTQETIYAARDCDGFWDEQARQTFVGQDVAIVLEVTSARFRILVETLDGAQSEFTVAGIWVQ